MEYGHLNNSDWPMGSSNNISREWITGFATIRESRCPFVRKCGDAAHLRIRKIWWLLWGNCFGLGSIISCGPQMRVWRCSRGKVFNIGAAIEAMGRKITYALQLIV